MMNIFLIHTELFIFALKFSLTVCNHTVNLILLLKVLGLNLITLQDVMLEDYLKACNSYLMELSKQCISLCFGCGFF